MTKYNLEFLEEKLGEFNKDFKYPSKAISGFNLIYIETQTKGKLEETLREIKDETNPGYIWGYVKETDAIYVNRAFGENNIFIYNPDFSKNKTDYIKGKLKVLNNLTEDKINDLFDQKAVFNYFYKKLWDLRRDLGIEIRDKNNVSDNKALMAAQNIIDRIIFTYFVCEKDLVTLNGQKPLDSKILFNSMAKMPDPWKCLKNLFFEQFAKKTSKPLMLGANTQIITPYLNGGLFRPKIIEHTSESDLNIEYTREKWQELFEHLNKYTWIVEDKIPDHKGEYEGNLTPEIIGHIYEKFVITMETLDEINLDELRISKNGDLKKGNKKIGAYYTPENITEYISKNTIKPYLYSRLGIIGELDFQDFINKTNQNTLLNAEKILNEISICDPACGSGAFLIKAGEILLYYKSEIQKKLGNKDIKRYNLKKEIIIKNLYGVDIQEGAVEICKLRLWLWLISSSNDRKVDPLPNIEYNFTVGNSLVGWANEKLEQSVLLQVDKMVLVVLDALKLRFESEEIEKIKEKLQNTDMKSYGEAMFLLKNIYSSATEDEAEKLKNIIESIRKVIYEKVNGIFYNHLKSKGTKISRDEYDLLNPFHWKIEFYHLFESGGFNLVIGNPPYIRVHKMQNEIKNVLRSNFISPYKDFDIYICFLERSCSIMGKNSFLGFINPDKFLIREYGLFNRIFMLNNFKILDIVDISHCDVFESIAVYPVINIFQKYDNVCILEKAIKKEIKSQIKIMHINDAEDLATENNVKKFIIEQSSILKNRNYSIEIYIDPETKNVLNKIEDGSIPLSDVSDNFCGTPRAKDYYKWAEIITDDKPTNNYCKYIVCRNISPYRINWGIKINSVKKTFYNPFLVQDDNLITNEKWNHFTDCNKIIIRGNDTRLTCVLNEEAYAGVGLYFLVNLKEDPKLILTILNSELINFYYKKKYASAHISGNFISINGIHLETIPIKIPTNKNVFKILCEYMLFLNSEDAIRDSNTKNIDFINDLIDNLVFELYFEEINTKIADLLSIENFKPEETPENKLTIIKKSIDKIKNNSELIDEINKIRESLCVKTIMEIINNS